MTPADFNIKITVRNARLLRAIRDDFGSSAAMSRATGISQSSIAALVNLRTNPFRQDGDLIEAAANICSALALMPEDLWPDTPTGWRMGKNSVEFEATSETVAAIGSMEDTVIHRNLLTKWSEKLSAREREIVTMRNDGCTYEECGKVFGFSKDRARQLELRSYSKMRKAAVQCGIRTLSDAL